LKFIICMIINPFNQQPTDRSDSQISLYFFSRTVLVITDSKK
jgi:hypothetical protein